MVRMFRMIGAALVLANRLAVISPMGCGTEPAPQPTPEPPPCESWRLGPAVEIERGPLICRIDAEMHGRDLRQVAVMWERATCRDFAAWETNIALVSLEGPPAVSATATVPSLFRTAPDRDGYITLMTDTIEVRDDRFEVIGTLDAPEAGIGGLSSTNPEVMISTFHEPELGGFIAFHLRRQEQIGAVRFTYYSFGLDFLADGTFMAIANTQVHRIRRGMPIETSTLEPRTGGVGSGLVADRQRVGIFYVRGDGTRRWIERADARETPLRNEHLADRAGDPAMQTPVTTSDHLLMAMRDGTIHAFLLPTGEVQVLPLGPPTIRAAVVAHDVRNDTTAVAFLHEDRATREHVVTLRQLICEAAE